MRGRAIIESSLGVVYQDVSITVADEAGLVPTLMQSVPVLIIPEEVRLERKMKKIPTFSSRSRGYFRVEKKG